MTTASAGNFGVGARFATVFPLNSSGLISATSTTVFSGTQLYSAKGLALTLPEPRKIVHTGDDRVLGQDFLPPLEGASGELRVGLNDYDAYAVLTGTLKRTIGESVGIGWGTDLQGSEPTLGFHIWQQAIDKTTKVRRWKSYILPSCLVIPRASSMDENPEEHTFSLLPNVCTKHLWGEAFTLVADGFTEAQIIERVTIYKPKIVAFKGDNSTVEFSFSASYPAVNTTGMVVWKNGTEVTTNLTKAVDKITFTAAPATGDIVVVWYEYA